MEKRFKFEELAAKGTPMHLSGTREFMSYLSGSFLLFLFVFPPLSSSLYCQCLTRIHSSSPFHLPEDIQGQRICWLYLVTFCAGGALYELVPSVVCHRGQQIMHCGPPPVFVNKALLEHGQSHCVCSASGAVAV